MVCNECSWQDLTPQLQRSSSGIRNMQGASRTENMPSRDSLLGHCLKLVQSATVQAARASSFAVKLRLHHACLRSNICTLAMLVCLTHVGPHINTIPEPKQYLYCQSKAYPHTRRTPITGGSLKVPKRATGFITKSGDRQAHWLLRLGCLMVYINWRGIK